MKVYVLFNYENKECEQFSDILGVYSSRELAERSMNDCIANAIKNINNPEYYNGEYENGYIVTDNHLTFDKVISNDTEEFLNGFRITEYDLGKYIKTNKVYVVFKQISVSDPNDCFVGDFEAFSTRERAEACLRTDSTDTSCALDRDWLYGADFDRLDPFTEYNFDDWIASTKGYFIGWNIEEFNVI